jgi:hypothetical protein
VGKTFKVAVWITKIWSLLSILFILAFFLGSIFGPDKSIDSDTSNLFTFIFFPIGVFIGLIIAWKSKMIGGFIAVISILGFHLFIDPEITVMIELLALPGLLFFILAIFEKKV